MPEAGSSARPAPSLQHLGLIWFVLVMGLSGLALAWAQASAVLGDTAGGVARVLGGLAAALFTVLLLLLAWRLLRWPNSLRLEWMHPVRYVFAATVPVSLILLATVAVVLTGESPAWDLLWQVGATAQGLLTVAVLWRWLRMPSARWMGVTPALLVPVVLALLVPRVRRLSLWPDRMRPSVFVLVAPPSVIGLDLMVWQVGLVPTVLFWALALGFLGLALTQLPRCFDQPFGMPMWSLSFPMAAFASLTLRLAAAGAVPGWVGQIALALASVVIAALDLVGPAQWQPAAA